MAHILENYAEDEAAGAGGARARRDAALALVAKRLGPDDTARAKQFLDGGDLADSVDVDREPPQHTDWEPVAAPRRRKGKGSGASPPRDA